MAVKKKIEVGVTPLLKTQPLIEGIETLFDLIEFNPMTPKEIVEKMRSRELDVALLPASEIFMKPNYTIIPDVSISCEGEHSGCVLFSKTLPDQIQRILVDKDAVVEYHLARLMVPRLLMVRPEYHESDMFFTADFDFNASHYDAFLAYGEDAYKLKNNFPLAWDLGAAWVKMTKMPFVMYVWAVRWGYEIGNLEKQLVAMKNTAIKNIASIAAREAKIRNVNPDFCKNYLSSSLRYDMGSVMISSLRLLNRMMFEDDICEKQLPIRFYNRTQTDYSGVM